MKIVRFQRVMGFWKRLFFIYNLSKMRNTLVSYLQEEGLDCSIADGNVVFDFNGYSFTVQLGSKDDIGECYIIFEYEDENYEEIDSSIKTHIANRVNSKMSNHVTALAYRSYFEIKTSFYFTNRKMLINLFASHFEEMIDAVIEADSELQEHKKPKPRFIGFNTGWYPTNVDIPEKRLVVSQCNSER